jgi:hypothetical protein
MNLTGPCRPLTEPGPGHVCPVSTGRRGLWLWFWMALLVPMTVKAAPALECRLDSELLAGDTPRAMAGRSGERVCVDSEGVLRQRGTWREGLPIGPQRQYDEQGRLRQLVYATGGRQAVLIEFHEDGSLRALRCAPASLLPEDRQPCGHQNAVSESRLYRSPGQLLSVVRYQAGQLVHQTVLDEQGRVVRTETLTDGRRVKRVYYPSGQLRSETERAARCAGP